LGLWSGLNGLEFFADMGELDRSGEAELVLDSVSDAFCWVGRDWTIRFMNRAGRDYFRLDQKEVLGRSVWEVFPAMKGTQIGDTLVGAMESRTTVQTGMWGATRPDRWSDVRVFPLDDGGLAVIWRDETDRKRHDDAVQETLRRQEGLYRELNHRIANGLQSVVGIVRLSTRAVGDPQSKAVIANAVDHIIALSLVHRRLYQSRGVEQQEVREYLETLCRELVKAFSSEAKPCAIACDVQPDAYTKTDTTLNLGLLLSELVMNAIKHGGCANLRVSFRVENATAKLQVIDDGKGLPADFDPTQAKGVGIRLVMAWAKALAGKLEFDHPGQGTTATLTFPTKGQIVV
jgi:two-component sensor histidine kinase